MQVKLQAGIQLPPITQRLVIYEAVEEESQALEERRSELMNRLSTMSDRRKEVEAKWDQVCDAYHMDTRACCMHAMCVCNVYTILIHACA